MSLLGYKDHHTFLLVLSLSQECLMETQERAFSVAAPRLWNTLPQEVRLVLSLSFHKQAKTFPFRQASPQGLEWHFLMLCLTALNMFLVVV